MNKKRQLKRLYNLIIIVLLVIAGCYAVSRFVHLGSVEWTDDAQIHRHVTPINTRIQGFIKEIRFNDYQYVHKGDTLVIIEDAEYRLQLAQAEANVRGSKSGGAVVSAGMRTTQSNVQVASAGIEETLVTMQNAAKDLSRYAALLKKGAVTQQQYDDMQTRYAAAKARWQQASHQRQSTALVKEEQVQRLSQNTAGVSVAEAALNLARLNLSYTVIVATADGYMGRKDIHEGQLVQPGQLLARIIDADDVWVIANYRETQIQHIRKGNDVEFSADAIPGVTFKGKVQALSFGTGSAYTDVPVDNATGNFVKVEQRVPVRIVLTDDNKAADVKRLLAGLNVEVKVKY
ncbi:MAG: HlyD family secretion protein [Prevotella sp.]|jgi:membrane fusion protein (multidrug efflux system)|nr:HlyD family secretion protein [Prevotella sp.]MCI1281140.1 HlyD family secretion protein [Prevotella sp.]